MLVPAFVQVVSHLWRIVGSFEKEVRATMHQLRGSHGPPIEIPHYCSGEPFGENLHSVICSGHKIEDASWLMNVPARGEGEPGHLGLPPIASNEPMLGLICEQIACLHTGRSLEEKAELAASLASLVQDKKHNGKLIMEEGGIGPLLKLIKEASTTEGQEVAAKAMGETG